MPNNPIIIKSYLKALQRGFQFMIDEPEKATGMLVKGKYFNVSQETLLFALKNQSKKAILMPNIDGMMLAINDMIKQDYIKSANLNVVQTKLLQEVVSKESTSK